MEMKPVTSKRITQYGYDEDSATVLVRFTNGECYSYRNVPPSVWAEFQASPSKGAFIGDVLDRYPYGPIDC